VAIASGIGVECDHAQEYGPFLHPLPTATPTTKSRYRRSLIRTALDKQAREVAVFCL
jgi:hypothetical protein